MIIDPVVARQLLEQLFRISGELDHSVMVARESLSENEFLAYRKAVGNVLGELWDEAIKPILQAHPELKPKDLDSA